jgi:hypothetical protein
MPNRSSQRLALVMVLPVQLRKSEGFGILDVDR